jgi:hypothetical protein
LSRRIDAAIAADETTISAYSPFKEERELITSRERREAPDAVVTITLTLSIDSAVVSGKVII